MSRSAPPCSPRPKRKKAKTKMDKLAQAIQGAASVFIVVGGMYTGTVQLPGIAQRLNRATASQAAMADATTKAVRGAMRAELRPLQHELARNSAAISVLTKRIGHNAGRLDMIEGLPRDATETTR